MDTYVIISAPDCKWCEKAKAALDERGLSYAEFSTDEPPVRHMFLALNLRTVPQILRAAWGNRPVEYIGGYDDLVRHLEYYAFAASTNSI